jgi:hypothetical protein
VKAPAAKVERPEDRSVPDFIYDVEKLEKMRGGELCAYASDVLIARATHIAVLEDSLIRIGHSDRWHIENAPTHDVLIGAALALEKIIAIGKEEYEALKPAIEKAKAEGKKAPRLHRLIEEAIEALRAGLIAEMRRRDPKKDEPVKEVADVAA